MPTKAKKRYSIWIYGSLMGGLLLILQLIEYKYSIRDIPSSLLILLLALIFTTIGIWVGLSLRKPKRKASDSDEAKKIQTRLSLLNISTREYEVIQLIGKGYSNQQIADQLHISLSTVKTHTSKVFSKLDVNRRTQLVQKARELKIID
jgi:DNA-binding CsgD family transcriptional regulator